jgi:hypothetical protein
LFFESSRVFVICGIVSIFLVNLRGHTVFLVLKLNVEIIWRRLAMELPSEIRDIIFRESCSSKPVKPPQWL